MKKILLTVLSVVLVAVLAIGGTLAYLTDTDSDVNVMTLGNVKIEQQEWQRADGVTYNNDGEPATEGDLVPFVQGQTILPAVPLASGAYSAELAKANGFQWGDYVTADGAWNGLWNENKIANVMDKIVMVKNTGKTEAYYRTIFAFECPEGMTYGPGSTYDFMMNMNSRFDKETVGFATIDGTRYMIQVATYKDVLTPGETSRPSLLQVLMTDHVTNEQVALLGDTYDILVFSQAVQAQGFADAQTALDTAFGDITTTNHPWADGVTMPTLVNNAEELQAALDNAVNGDTVVLGADIEGNVTVTQKADVKITLDGNGKNFDGTITVDGKSKTYTTAGLTIQDVNFVADSISADACINLGDGTNATRYTCNVTVSGCTFDVPGAVGVKSYTGGDKNLVIKDCTATANAHSLAQLKGVDGVLVENCTVNSKNGINFNNSDNVTVIGCDVDTKGYAVRFGESSGGAGAAETYAIKDCTLKSACDDGDAVIVLRGTADYATLTIENTTIEGSIDITNTATGATVVK